MRVTFLGTGTSVGVPVIGCDCAVCRSTDPRNKRRRTSFFVEAAGQHVLVDTPPDFREQALAYRLPRIDAVCFTHAHADHIFGFDDIRRYNTMQGGIIPAYGSASTLRDLQRVFNYIGGEPEAGTYRPQISFETTPAHFAFGELAVEPVLVEHGNKPTQGYLFRHDGRSVAYVPDCHGMAERTVAQLAGIDVMVLDGLRDRPHPTHLTIDESVAVLKRIGARTSYLIHMAHDLDHAVLEARLPAGIKASYDGLVLEW